MRFWMRKQCCSSFFQGTRFQASLALPCGSGGAFLAFIWLTFYLPYSRVHVSISSGFPRGIGFLDHRLAGDIGWHLLAPSTCFARVFLRFPRSTLLFCATVDACLSTEHLPEWAEKGERSFPTVQHCCWRCQYHFWSSLLSYVGLVPDYGGSFTRSLMFPVGNTVHHRSQPVTLLRVGFWSSHVSSRFPDWEPVATGGMDYQSLIWLVGNHAQRQKISCQRFQRDKRRSTSPVCSRFSGNGSHHLLLECTRDAPVWPSRVGSGRDDRPFFHGPLVFSAAPYPPPASFCQCW